MFLFGNRFADFHEFKQGLPVNYIYRLDNVTPKKDEQHYYQVFSDAGWEQIGAMGGWQYFRKEAKPGESPEIYTDPQSKIEKNRRLMLFLIILNPVYWSVLAISRGDSTNRFCDFIFYCLPGLMLLFVIAIEKLAKRIKELKAF